MDRDNVQSPKNGGDTNIDFKSKNIKQVDNTKLFTKINDETPRHRKILPGIGKFFKKHTMVRLILILILIITPLAIWVFVRTTVPRDIMIGDIRITRAEINSYADEMRQYKELNPEIILDDPIQFATDNLIENAALRHYAQTECADLEVDLSPVEAIYPNKETFYLRIPAENGHLKTELRSCIVANKTLFNIAIFFDMPYFRNLEPEPRAEAYATAIQKLNDTFLPMFEADLSAEEIAAHPDVDANHLADSFEVTEEMWASQILVHALLQDCGAGGATCFDDTDTNYVVQPDNLVSTIEQVQSLKEIGDHTAVFASKAGVFTIIRLEEKSGGKFDSYEDFLEDIRTTYIKTDFLSKLFASTVQHFFTIPDVSAGGIVTFYFRAITDTGATLGTWEEYADCGGGNPFNWAFDYNYNSKTKTGGKAYWENTNNQQYSMSNFGRNYSGYEGLYWMWTPFNSRSWGSFNSSWQNPNPLSKNRKVFWTQGNINAQGALYIYLVYKGTAIDATAAFASRSTITTPYGTSTSKWNNTITRIENNNTVILVPEDGEVPLVPVTFKHEIQLSNFDPDKAKIGTANPCLKSLLPGASINNPCTRWSISSTGSRTTGNKATGSIDASSLLKAADKISLVNGGPGTTKNIRFPRPSPPPTGKELGEIQAFDICETIVYSPQYFSGKVNTDGSSPRYTGSDSGTSGACAQLKFQASNKKELSSCSTPTYAFDQGWTFGRSGVRKNTGNFSYTKNTRNLASDQVTIYARPGDGIQFVHELCPGAQAVRHRNEGEEKRERVTALPNTYSISATTSPITPGLALSSNPTSTTLPATNYLFGGTDTTNGAKAVKATSVNVNTGTATTGELSPKSGDYASIVHQSPNNRKYPCTKGGGANNPTFPALSLNGYQIPGSNEKDGSCQSVAASDAGKTISQTLTFAQIEASATGYANSNRSTNLGNATRTANVKIPFNYVIAPPNSDPDKSPPTPSLPTIPNGGSDGNIDVRIRVDKKTNPDPNLGEYATVTKPTNYEVIAFTADSSLTNKPSSYGGSTSITHGCAAYSPKNNDCTVVDQGTGVIFNPGNQSLYSGSITIPDAEVGTKFCVAYSIFPASSHGTENNNDGLAMNATAGASASNPWLNSEATCVSIVKKPTIQFLSAGLYTKSSVTTSQTKKAPGNMTITTPSSIMSGTRRVFGSWSEYEAIVFSNHLTGLASGAAFGYNRNNQGNNGKNHNPAVAATTTIPNNNIYFSVNPGSTDPELCTYATQTFSNKDCASKVAGKSNINSMGPAVLSRLISRFTLPSSGATQDGSSTPINASGTCSPNSSGGYSASGSHFKCLNNGAKYIKVNGDASLPAYTLAFGETLVIDVSGKLTIKGNIIYPNGSYTDLDQLPQSLIFAGNINVDAAVSRVDSWIIAGQHTTATPKGTINTCSGHTDYSKLDANTCNQQLTFNGPVFAREINLTRTAGAGRNTESIVSAEVFNLRVDSYLWSYGQARSTLQAITTYSRELAPRY